VIVGLGNPEARYAGTPHNTGYEVVDRIAVSLRLTWESVGRARIARGASNGRRLCLVKIEAPMNLTGQGLLELSRVLSFRPEQCILICDDLELPLGSVRTRPRGGAGGHRGIASVLVAFQTEAFRRVKVGVGQADAKLNRVEYVLTSFDAESRAAMDIAISAAADRTLEMVEHPSVSEAH